MPDRHGDPASEAMRLARRHALDRGHEVIDTEHLLLGVVGASDGLAARLLDAAGVAPQRVRDAIEDRMRPGAGRLTPRQLPFTPRVRRALECALDEARGLGHAAIGTEHLLLGLAAADEGIAAQVLRHLHVTVEEVRSRLRAARGADAQDPPPTA